MSARRAAGEILVAVLEQRMALDDALERVETYASLEGRDRAFARAIATAALRRLGGLDAVVATFLERPLPDTAPEARALLRIGAAQLLLLNTPAHAAVGETVAAANTMRGGRPFSRLINAVLRKVASRGADLLAAQKPGADLPAWLFTRWRAAYGADADAIALALKHEPPLDLSVKDGVAAWAEKLNGVVTPTGSLRIPSPKILNLGEGTEGWGQAPASQHFGSDAHKSEPSAHHPTPRPLPSRGGGVATLDGYSEGAWWVQDAAAALPARMLGDVRAKSVLDLCAAPGGKTLQLAAASARVIAIDRSDARVNILRANLARTKLAAEVMAADATTWRPHDLADAILLDAPCTATGTLRRHPDIAWLRRPDDVRKLAALQTRLLAATAEMVKPGGVLVYAVCSLEPEEGPAIVRAALRSGVWKRAPLSRDEIPGAENFITLEGDLRTLPSYWAELGGLDGFYAARLVRA